jgi:hypothetical protein
MRPVKRSSFITGIVLALLVGVGLGWELGHSSPATPIVVATIAPTPSGSGVGSFTVIESGLNNSNPLKPTFTFTFSKPILNAATFNFGDITTLYVQAQPPPHPALRPPMTLNTLGGASGSFDPTGAVTTVAVQGSLTEDFAYFINFTNLIIATDGTPLTFASIRYPSSGTLLSVAHRRQLGMGRLADRQRGLQVRSTTAR